MNVYSLVLLQQTTKLSVTMTKAEKIIIEKYNNLVREAAKYGIYIGGVTLRKSRNTWTFCGQRVVVEALTAHSDVLLPTLEKHAAEIGENMSLEGQIDMDDAKYQTQKVLPPMPTKLASLPLIAARSYVSHGVSILTGISDTRLLYRQPKPRWWLAGIPFEKPGIVPESFQSEFGSTASAEWHNCLRAIIYMMHHETSQDFRINVDPDVWKSFGKK